MRSGIPIALWLAVLAFSSPGKAENIAGHAIGLHELLEVARKNPPSVLAAWARVQSAKAQIELATAALKPTLTGSASALAGAIQTHILYGESHIPPGLVFPGVIPTLALDAGVSLNWLVSDFGRSDSQISASRRAAQVAGHVARSAEHEAMATAANAFFVVLSDQDLLEQLRETLTQHERELELIRSLVRNGVRPMFDQQRAEVALEATRAEVTVLEGTWQQHQASLLAALASEHSTLQLRLLRPESPPVDDDPERAGSAALVASPALDAARSQVVQAQLQLRAWQAAANRPVLTANASAGVRYANRVRSDGLSTQGAVALVLSVPWIDPNTSANAMTAAAELSASRAELARVTHVVRVDAEQAALSVRTAQAALLQSQRLSDSAVTALQQAQVLYEAGSATLLDLLVAQDRDTKARVSAVRARLALELCTVHLLSVTNRITEWSTRSRSAPPTGSP